LQPVNWKISIINKIMLGQNSGTEKLLKNQNVFNSGLYLEINE